MASVNPYILQGNVGLEAQKSLDNSMLQLKMLAVQEQKTREANFIKMMDVKTVNMVKDNAQAEQLKRVSTLNTDIAKIYSSTNYNPPPEQVLQIEQKKRDLMQWQQSILQYQDAYAKDRAALAQDAGQKFDMDEGMQVLNGWNGTTPYTQGDAIVPLPKNMAQLIHTIVDDIAPIDLNLKSVVKTDKGSNEETYNYRSYIYSNVNGKQVLDQSKYEALKQQLLDNKDIQYGASYFINKQLNGYTLQLSNGKYMRSVDADSQTQKAAQQALLDHWSVSTLDAVKGKILDATLYNVVAPVKGSSTVLDKTTDSKGGPNGGIPLKPGMKTNYTFTFDNGQPDETSEATAFQGTLPTVNFNAKDLGPSNFRGAINAGITVLGPKYMVVKAAGVKTVDYGAPALEAHKTGQADYQFGKGGWITVPKMVDGETAVDKKGKTIYEIRPLKTENERMMTIPVTADRLKQAGKNVVNLYNKMFGDSPDNVFKTKSSPNAPDIPSVKLTPAQQTALKKWGNVSKELTGK